MLSNHAHARLITKFPAKKSDQNARLAAKSQLFFPGEKPARPRPVTLPPKLDDPVEMKTMSESIHLVQTTHPHRSTPQKLTTTKQHRASNLYQAISPASGNKSTLTLSRADSGRRINQGSSRQQSRVNPSSTLTPPWADPGEHCWRSLPPPSHPASLSSRRLHREDDDDLDQPMVPSRERRCARTQNTLETPCNIIQAQDVENECTSSPPVETLIDDQPMVHSRERRCARTQNTLETPCNIIQAQNVQNDCKSSPPAATLLDDAFQEKVAELGSWSSPSPISFESSEVNADREQQLGHLVQADDRYGAEAECTLGTKCTLVEAKDSNGTTTSSPTCSRFVSFDYEKENSEPGQQTENDWLGAQEEKPLAYAGTPEPNEINNADSPLSHRSVSVDSGTKNSLDDNQADDSAARQHLVNVARKTVKRKVGAQSSFLEGNLSQMGSLYFGRKPIFKESRECGRKLSLAKRDPRKVIDKHLRVMGTALGQKLSLNRRGICYFYYEELFVYVEVPGRQDVQANESFMISTVLHQLIPGKDVHVKVDEFLENVRDLERTSPEPVAVGVKNKRKITLSCTREVSPNYVDFGKCMKDFRKIAVQMKEKLRNTTPRHPFPQIVEF